MQNSNHIRRQANQPIQHDGKGTLESPCNLHCRERDRVASLLSEKTKKGQFGELVEQVVWWRKGGSFNIELYAKVLHAKGLLM